MARRNVGVVILPPDPIRAAIDALRDALGDREHRRIPTHITIVPPVNVAADQFDTALEVLRSAAKASRRFGLELGPAASFLPHSPTLYLSVGGDVAGLHALRARVFVEPLARPLTWPFVPHVTLSDGAGEERIGAAIAALTDAHYAFDVRGLHLLEEQRSHVWTPIAEFPLAR